MPKWKQRRAATAAAHSAAVENGWRQLQRLWGPEGLRAAGEVMDVLRQLEVADLAGLEAQIPKGTGLTERKCQLARDLLRSVLEE